MFKIIFKCWTIKAIFGQNLLLLISFCNFENKCTSEQVVKQTQAVCYITLHRADLIWLFLIIIPFAMYIYKTSTKIRNVSSIVIALC